MSRTTMELNISTLLLKTRLSRQNLDPLHPLVLARWSKNQVNVNADHWHANATP